MKRKIKIGTLLWSLLFALGSIGLIGCDKDDEHLGDDVYQGYIKDINLESDFFIIKVTHSAYNSMEMPKKDELLSVSISDFPNVELKIQQNISFRILSAEAQFIPAIFSPNEYPSWRCKIKIFKLD